VIDYSPDLQQFNDQLDQLLNDAFYFIWNYKRWTFSTKIVTFPFYPDMLPGRDNEASPGTPVTATLIEGQRKVTFSAGMDRLLLLRDIWEGSPISIQNFEYTISKVLSTSELLLTEAFRGTSSTTDITWVIKKRYYDLPSDCLELLYLGHRDYPYNTSAGSFPPFGKSTGLVARREEELDMRADYKASYAEAYVQSPSVSIPSGEKLWMEAKNTVGATIPSSTYYEICWGFMKDGKIGALSKPETILVSPQMNSFDIHFTGWDDLEIIADTYQTNDLKATPWEGYRKVIFWNKNFDRTSGVRTGLPCWIRLINGGVFRNSTDFNRGVVVEDISSVYHVTYITQFDNGAERYIEIDGQWNRIRPYPRVDAWDFEIKRKVEGGELIVPKSYVKEGIIRYYKKPSDILLSTDSPELPYEFHPLIVTKVLEDIYMKLGQTVISQTYKARFEKEIKELQKDTVIVSMTRLLEEVFLLDKRDFIMITPH
jgi:hypothetical protein